MMRNAAVMMMSEVRVDTRICLIPYRRRWVPPLKASLQGFVERYGEKQNQKVAQAQGMNFLTPGNCSCLDISFDKR